eukprot:SAG11_NODE_2685_length_3101_cov_1.843771_6_plen_46_part_00
MATNFSTAVMAPCMSCGPLIGWCGGAAVGGWGGTGAGAVQHDGLG